MKTTRRIFTSALTALALAAISTGAWAAPKDCGIIGTWGGMDKSGGTDIVWLGVHSPGTSDSRGAMILEWIYVKPSLLLPDWRLGPGRGVWEQTTKGKYKYTWYAYATNTLDGSPAAIVRVGGTAANNGCDTIDITYLFEVFDFTGQFEPYVPSIPFSFPNGIPTDAVPLDSATGNGVQYRVPLVTLP